MRLPHATCLIVASASLAWLALAGAAGASDGAPPDGTTPEEFFLRRVRPVLERRCWRCHGPEKQRSDLRLDSREAVLRGGRVRDVEVGRPEASRLIDAVGYDDGDLQMPPDGKLADAQIADLATWVRMGVPWAETRADARPAETRDPAARAPSRESGLLARAGRFHPLVVHFPIALILAAALGEGAALVASRRGRHGRSADLATASRYALFLGSAGALAAAALGWLAAGSYRVAGESAAYLEAHRWLGTAVGVSSAVLGAWAALAGRSDPSASRKAYRIALFACALLVGLVGHLGGSLTHGIGWLGLP